MDALVELLPLLFIGAYYLLAGRRRAKQKKEAREQAQPAGPAEQRAATPFQNFLEQLEEAMSEASGDPAAEVVPQKVVPRKAPVLTSEPVPAAEPIPESRLESIEFNAPAGSFGSSAPVDHQAHGFGAENPISEETFERQPASAQTARRDASRYDPHGLRSSADAPSENTWNKRLGNPKAAQDAFVLQTVFGTRGGRRPKGR